ncbi:MAG: polyribonucleotide nucleotidyltransferase [Alphaproteobacteria bacterium]|nr:polyribonucleotide nucleotidyltransferase [Alphaproteobacteria bacterium]
MFNVQKESFEWGGRTLTLETGKVARQADGAVIATYGETVVLATVVGAANPKEGVDFFPLTVNYQERYYAAGKIPGGYFKRERAPTERETLISRLIDRPIRPLFADGYRNETQVVVQVLSHDLENDPDIVGMVAASAALTISGVPFMGPIGAARVAYIDGEYKLNPPIEEMANSKLDLVVAGTRDAVMMVESEAQELSEAVMLGAVVFGHKEMQHAIDAIIRLAEKAAKEPRAVPEDIHAPVRERLKVAASPGLAKAFQIADKHKRRDAISAERKSLAENFVGEGEGKVAANVFSGLMHDVEAHVMRSAVLDTKKRVDGRDLVTVRPIMAEVGVLPRTHGSALFTRGETQALVIATLGTAEDEQFVDSLEGTSKQTFMLHYNFPPYSVGETGRMGSPGRREIGHGKLAWRAIHPMLPTKDSFPYTIRVVSEITESNGSSSMATVCGTSLALMDAGVPIAKPTAGIAMGLILEGDRYVVLSDILGDEDHLGDMDFKVAGTEDGVTSLQMDIKIAGITEEIMRAALDQAKGGRLHILGEMNKAIHGARAELGEHAPRIEQIKIPTDKIRDVIGTGGKVIREIVEKTGAKINIETDKIRDVIGTGGKVIREIVEKTGAKINIEDDGTVKIASADGESIKAALKWIRSLTAEPEVGEIYDGKIVKVMDFGAFVNFFGPKDGLVHVSELAAQRVAKPSDVVKEGQAVKVKLLGFDDRGKVRLSMKQVDQATGEDLSKKQAEAKAEAPQA